MESEKVKEIKKGLEERTQHNPINCSHSEYVEACGMYCRHRREFVADMGIKNGQTCKNCNKFTATDEVKEYADILTLINELESENERLLNQKWDKEDDLDNYHEENKQLKAENERLKEQNGALSCDLDLLNEKLTNAEIEVDDYKNRIAEGELVSKDWHDEQIGQAENRIVELEKELNERVIVRATKEANILNEIRENARREALTQFFEKVKDKLKDNVDADRVDYYVEFTTFMSSTLIEMLEKRCSNVT